MRRLRDIFGKRRPSVGANEFEVPLDQDPRWKRFNGLGTPCACCGRTFSGVFDIGCNHPSYWEHGNFRDCGDDHMQVGSDYLSSDFCKIGEHNFVRTVLRLPIVGTEKEFGFGCWGSVSKDTLQRYLDAWTGKAPFEGGFSWLSNTLPTFELQYAAGPIACDMILGGANERPLLYVHGGDLADAQAKGITFDHLLDIYAASGTDIRPHLVD